MNLLDCQRVLDALPDALIACNAANQIVYLNLAAEHLLGWSAEALRGRSLLEILPARLHAAHNTGLQRYLTPGGPVPRGRIVCLPILHQNGTEIDVELTAAPLSDQGGGLVLASLRDVRERSEREHPCEQQAHAQPEEAQRAALAVENARLRQEAQEAIRAREQFLSIASHELRTPLTPLHLQLQLLLRHIRQNTLSQLPPGRLATMLEICERQVKQMMKLITDLLDVSRITAGRLQLQLEEVDLAVVVRDVVTRFAVELAQAGCPLEVQAPPAVTGTWDRLRLEQVVTNLLANAIKYGPGKSIEMRLESDGPTARLTVRDQGIGIAPEDQTRIFDRFERAVAGRQHGGLGLGLYIVSQVVAASGGSIRVASEPGAGSTFTVTLPRKQ